MSDVQPTVGVAMKLSRFKDLASRGFFPDSPDAPFSFHHFDICKPVDPDTRVDVLLHKISDAIAGDEPFEQLPAVERLQALTQANPGLCLVDSLNDVAKVLDRVQLTKILQQVESQTQSGVELLTPKTIEVPGHLTLEEVQAAAGRAGLHLPGIWKPAAACGTPEAHCMAIVFDWMAIKQLPRGRPAILQEFVNHDSILYKVYVIGKQVHWVQKPSLCNLPPTGGPLQPSMIPFDSLAALPALGKPANGNSSAKGTSTLSQEVVKKAVAGLRQHLQLTLFGFDMIVDCKGSHYIIDVNYFPSFKEIPNAHKSLWKALQDAYSHHKSLA